MVKSRTDHESRPTKVRQVGIEIAELPESHRVEVRTQGTGPVFDLVSCRMAILDRPSAGLEGHTWTDSTQAAHPGCLVWSALAHAVHRAEQVDSGSARKLQFWRLTTHPFRPGSALLCSAMILMRGRLLSTAMTCSQRNSQTSVTWDLIGRHGFACAILCTIMFSLHCGGLLSSLKTCQLLIF